MDFGSQRIILQSGTELSKVERAESGSRVPSGGGRITLLSTSRVVTLSDIAKTTLALGRVEKRVDEPKVRLALRLAIVVQDRDEGGPGWRRSRCAKNTEGLSIDDNLEVLRNQRDIGVSSALSVVVMFIAGAVSLSKGSDIRSLVIGGREVVGEATTAAAIDPSVLGNSLRAIALELGTTDGSAPGAESRPHRNVTVGAGLLAISTNTVVTGREKDGNTAGASLHEVVADAVHVAPTEVGLLTTIGGGSSGRRVGGRVQVAGKVGHLILEVLSVEASSEQLARVGVSNAADVLRILLTILLYLKEILFTNLSVQVTLKQGIFITLTGVLAARYGNMLEPVDSMKTGIACLLSHGTNCATSS